MSRVSRRWRAEGIDAAFWLLHHFFDGHVREMLRVEHEPVILIQLREAQPRLVMRIQLLRIFEEGEQRRN